MNDYNQLYHVTFLWGVVVVASFLGYGRLLCNAFDWEKDGSLGWGLRAVIGMSGVLSLGGLLLLTSTATSDTLFWVTLAGAAAWFVTTVQDVVGGKIKPDWIDLLKNAPFWILVAIYYSAGVAWIKEIDPNDDLPGYFVFPFAIQQTGTLLEPFSFRRAIMFGGHPLLQAITALFGSEKNFQFVDIGIGKLLLFGVLSHFLRVVRKNHYFIYFAFLAVALVFHFPRINASSLQLHVVFALALGVVLSTKSWSLSVEKLSFAILPAILIAAASTFRPQMAFLGGCLFAISAVLTSGLRTWKKWSLQISKVGAISFALLIPWVILLWKASGTPFLPPFFGNANPVFLSIHAVDGNYIEKVAASASAIMIPELLAMAAIVIVLFVFKRTPVTIGFSVAISLTLLMFAWNLNAIPPPYFYRYTIPFIIAWWTWVMAEATMQLSGGFQKHKGFVASNIVAWGIAFGAASIFQWQPAVGGLRAFASAIPEEWNNAKPLFPEENYKYHRDLQSLIPPGAPILVMVDAPYMFNLKRNPILNIESVGQCSPWGGLPYFKGSQALRSYLKNNGVHNVIYVHSDKALMYYKKDYWLHHPWPKQYSFINEYGKYVLDFINSIESLDAQCPSSKKTESHSVFKL